MESRLTPLQCRVLEILAPVEPPFTLTGGGALGGYHLGHRTTRDLDLFWHGRKLLETLPDEVEVRLVDAGLRVERIRTAPMFRRITAADTTEVVVIDLVADPVPVIEAPVRLPPGILVDTPHEILVNKLCALLSRSETRDLVDVEALLLAGGSLDRALVDAAKKDGGFSPQTLAWVLQTVRMKGWEAHVPFRDQLIDRLLSD